MGRLGSPRPSISTVFEDVSSESPTYNKRRPKRTPSTFHFVEDVSGETAISEYSGDFATDLNISFFEDVPRESLIFSIKRLKTKLSTSHFWEDVSSETAISE